MRDRALIVCLLICLMAPVAASAGDFLRIDGALPAGGDCLQFGSWDAPSATCVIQDALLPTADRLDIAAATVEVVGTMTNEGLMVNDGTLVVQGFLNNANDLVNNWTATMVVSGTYFSHFMYNFGTLINHPGALVDFDFFLENNGPLINRGALRIGGTLFNIPERWIENFGLIEISATGSVSNDGLFVHAGQLDNQGTLQNNASFVVHCDSELTGNAPLGDAPTGAQSITVAKQSLAWCAVPGASGYDVVVGDLTLLRASAGDFSSSTTACLADSIQALSLEHTIPPPSGTGWWFLVRADGIASAGFDTVFSSQVGERADEIASSAGGCH